MVLVAVGMFLVGVAVGLLVAEVYPRHDAVFREYLRREYGIGKRPKD
jgi:hypothetical protein